MALFVALIVLFKQKSIKITLIVTLGPSSWKKYLTMEQMIEFKLEYLCPACYAPLHIFDKLMMLDCGHYGHKFCLKNREKCPRCYKVVEQKVS
jgi:DNA-directed RNA polymerase subunit RPC12/RpoP